jgi:mRNA interferase MazF
MEQYNVCSVNLDPTIGSEIRKTRPAVIISPDEMNLHLNTIVIVPMTSIQKGNYPTRQYVKGENFAGYLVIDQIRTVDKSRICQYIGKLTAEDIKKLKLIIQEMLID